jgi:hypothetical protein
MITFKSVADMMERHCRGEFLTNEEICDLRRYVQLKERFSKNPQGDRFYTLAKDFLGNLGLS